MPFRAERGDPVHQPDKDNPSFLAAGLAVCSTPIADVITPYGLLGLVEIATDAESFAAKLDFLIARTDASEWAGRAWMSICVGCPGTIPGRGCGPLMLQARPSTQHRADAPEYPTSPADLRQGVASVLTGLLVGAGFRRQRDRRAGLPAQRNAKVLVIDRRNHVGGNAYDPL